MTEQPVAEGLQFDRAEFGANQQAIVCTSCRQPITQSYYDAGGRILCSPCREKIEQAAESWGGTRIAKALIAGFGAAVAGAILWWGVREISGYEIGLVSVVIGIGVGKAVRWGSGNRGGRAYQILAVLLTYTAVAFNYTPDVIKGIRENVKQEESAQKTDATAAKKDAPITAGQAALGALAIFALAAAAPFFAGFENIIGLAIIAFGLWEAWKINRRLPLAISGPYSVTPAHG